MRDNTIADVSQTFLDQLKSKTSQSHKNLENLPVSKSIISPTLTIAEYTNYLGIMADVIADTETSVFALLHDIIPDIKQRGKLSSIQNDLSTLGFDKKSFEPVFVKSPFSPAFALGIMYVVEGSSLGGRFILKNINDTLGLDQQKGATYFAGYGNQTGIYWKNFLNFLSSYEAENDCAEEIIAGADYAFNAIYKHFSKASS